MSVVDEELQRIYDRDGEILPEVVVSEAAATGSRLHGYFEWDDGRAGHLYRVEQARRLIRTCVTVTKRPDRVIDTRTWVSVPRSDDRKSYISTADALQRADSREFVLRMAERDITVFRRKYESLIDLDQFFLGQVRKPPRRPAAQVVKRTSKAAKPARVPRKRV